MDGVRERAFCACCAACAAQGAAGGHDALVQQHNICPCCLLWQVTLERIRAVALCTGFALSVVSLQPHVARGASKCIVCIYSVYTGRCGKGRLPDTVHLCRALFSRLGFGKGLCGTVKGAAVNQAMVDCSRSVCLFAGIVPSIGRLLCAHAAVPTAGTSTQRLCITDEVGKLMCD
jgi:hypothetical protein